MSLRFRRSLRVGRGVRLNITGRGPTSLSVGRPGATLNLGRRGLRGTVGLPATGLSYSSRIGAASVIMGAVLGGVLALVTSAARGHRGARLALTALVLIVVLALLRGGGTPSFGNASASAVPATNSTPSVQASSASRARPIPDSRGGALDATTSPSTGAPATPAAPTEVGTPADISPSAPITVARRTGGSPSIDHGHRRAHDRTSAPDVRSRADDGGTMRP